MARRKNKIIYRLAIDGLKGFEEAISAVFPKTEIQRCIIHQIRYSTKFISYKDIKGFMNDLKLVYKTDTEDLALQNLDRLDEKWSGKYPNAIKSWRANWTSLATFFRYLPELRRMIYTTNAIENFNP